LRTFALRRHDAVLLHLRLWVNIRFGTEAASVMYAALFRAVTFLSVGAACQA